MEMKQQPSTTNDVKLNGLLGGGSWSGCDCEKLVIKLNYSNDLSAFVQFICISFLDASVVLCSYCANVQYFCYSVSLCSCPRRHCPRSSSDHSAGYIAAAIFLCDVFVTFV